MTVYIYTFLTSALVWSQWSASRLNRIKPEEELQLHSEYEVGWDDIWDVVLSGSLSTVVGKEGNDEYLRAARPKGRCPSPGMYKCSTIIASPHRPDW